MISEKRQLLRPEDIPAPIKDREDLQEFIASFQRIFRNYHSAMKMASAQLEIWDDEFAATYDHSPIHHMECRVKSAASLVSKMERKGYPLTIGNVQRINDIAGIRVVCNYINDIYYLADLIKKIGCFKIISEKDYIKDPKPNGYRSLHLVVGVAVAISEGMTELPVEIQLRSIAMDLWASLEHELRYKSDREFDPKDEQSLKLCAETLAVVDKRMQKLFLHQEEGKQE